MKRPCVAYLACPDTLPGSNHRREDAYEHDLTMGHLGLGMHYIGRTLESVSWDNPKVDWSRYEAAIIGTTWDYTRRLNAFLDALDSISQQTKLLNSLATVHWNTRKSYLQDLQSAGCATIPTLWCDSLDEAAGRDAFEAFACDTIVIKPQVGAGAWRQSKLHRDELWPSADELPIGPAMVQPFQSSITTEGEMSFLFFGNDFSHAVIKKPAKKDYRIQSSYGGYDMPHHPDASDVWAAQQVVNCVSEPTLYARVDMVRGDDGRLRLMELEAIEPYLYPMYAPHMGHMFAKAYLQFVS